MALEASRYTLGQQSTFTSSLRTTNNISWERDVFRSGVSSDEQHPTISLPNPRRPSRSPDTSKCQLASAHRRATWIAGLPFVVIGHRQACELDIWAGGELAIDTNSRQALDGPSNTHRRRSLLNCSKHRDRSLERSRRLKGSGWRQPRVLCAFQMDRI